MKDKKRTRKQKAPAEALFANQQQEKMDMDKAKYTTPRLALQPLDCPKIRRWMTEISRRMAEDSALENYDRLFCFWSCLFTLLQRAQGFKDYPWPGGEL